MPQKKEKAEIIYRISRMVKFEGKDFKIDADKNLYGPFVKITEEVRGRKNTVFIPTEDKNLLEELISAIRLSADEADALPDQAVEEKP